MGTSNMDHGSDSTAKSPDLPGSDSSDSTERSFAAALRAANDAPGDSKIWDEVEDLADQLQRPDEVSTLFRDVIDGPLSPEVRSALADRAMRFHEEWFGDDPATTGDLLLRILARDPKAQWAFERLTMVYTVAERWEDLLALYDRRLASTEDRKIRRKLLTDAGHVAKDFADQPGRAVDYQREVLELEPENEQLAASVERLLERLGRWKDLVEVWHARISAVSADQRRELRVRIARCNIDHLEDAAAALEELKVLATEFPGDSDACAELERILGLESANLEIRTGALGVLRGAYEAAGRADAIVDALERAVVFAPAHERRNLHREAGRRLGILGRDADAMGHYASILRDEPADTDARKELRALARRSGRHDAHAQALIEAADGAQDEAQSQALLVEAGDVRRDALGDAAGAVELYDRVLKAKGVETSQALAVAHRIEALLAADGRAEERLSVLERIADLEASTIVQRSILAEAGRLADSLGDLDRALTVWRRRLDADADDLEALNAVVDLLARADRPRELVEALRRRVGNQELEAQKRADLVRIATLTNEALQDPETAIEVWQEILETFGVSADVLDALDELMSRTDRWRELADVLDQSAASGYQATAARLARLGEIHRSRLEDPPRAVADFIRALELDPGRESARDGLRSLLDNDECGAQAAEGLARAHTRLDEWSGLVDIVDLRARHAGDDRRRARLFQEAAELAERRGEDAASALTFVARALPLVPDDVVLENDLIRLAEATGGWDRAAEALLTAARRSEDRPARAAALRIAAAQILADRLNRGEEAVDVYSAAASAAQAGETEAISGVVRTAARAGQWPTAAHAAVPAARAFGQLGADILGPLEAGAGIHDAWGDMVQAVERALEMSDELEPGLRRSFLVRIARWHRDRTQDHAAAERSATQACEIRPLDREALDLLIELRRKEPGQPLADALLMLDQIQDQGLDALHEAAQLSLELGDDDRAAELITRLYHKASGMWRQGVKTPGERTPEQSCTWALDHQVALLTKVGRRAEAAALLLDAAHLPTEAEHLRGYRRRAAGLLVELDHRGQAIDLLRGILAETPHDRGLVRELAGLCQDEEHLADLLVLRRREVELTQDNEERLALRLEISQLVGRIEDRGGRVDSLRANLEETPGHRASIDAVTHVLEARGQRAELADLLAEQARRLATADDGERAAELWSKVAVLAEGLDQTDRAIDAHTAVARLRPTTRALDALARLHREREEPALAAMWLEQRLEMTEGTERVPVQLRLAKALLEGGQNDRALPCLVEAFEAAPRNGEVRRLLLHQYRTREAWRPLAKALTRAAEHVNDREQVLAFAREASDIFSDRLDVPEQAVPVLERASQLAADDKELKARLAYALRLAGRHDEARELLVSLITAYGRRRSPERASVHLELARVARDAGDTDQAIEQLEQATNMDRSNVTAMATLAELAHETGQLDRAERTYRALLLAARQSDEESRSIGPSEVLYELSRIAHAREQSDKASELVESTLEALRGNDREGPGLQERVAGHGDHALLRRVLETRLEQAVSPRRRANVAAALAELMEGPLEQASEALDLWFQALDEDPGNPTYHDVARARASDVGRIDAYASKVEALLERLNRTGDTHARCELLLRLGEVMEKDREDLTRASELYSQAEATGVREVDVWRAAARVAEARGDTDTQMRLLERLAGLGADRAETRVDALYRLAEVQLADPDTQAEGVQTLRRALDDDDAHQRAAIILGRAADAGTPSEDLLSLYERVARASQDDEILLHYLERRASHAEATPEQVREGAELAGRLGEAERADALMMRAVEIAGDVLDGGQRTAWALLGLAKRRTESRDLPGAVKWLGEAVEVAEPERLFALAADVAELIENEEADVDLVAKLYEQIRERDPGARQVWEPLAGFYRRLGDTERLERLVESTLNAVAQMGDRNAMRLLLADTLMATEERRPDGVGVLREILLEDPENDEAQHRLADHYEQTGQEEELLELLRRQLMAAHERSDQQAIGRYGLRLGNRLEASNLGEAISVYRVALEAGDDADLLMALLSHVPPAEALERATLLDRLVGVAQVNAVTVPAVEASELFAVVGEEARSLAVLEKAYMRAPADETLREHLRTAYTDRGDQAGLARMLETAASGSEDPQAQRTLLCEAAHVYRDGLGRSDRAVELLTRVVDELGDHSPEVVGDLVESLAEAGEPDEGLERLARLLDGELSDADRRQMLMRRAILRRATGDGDGAIADLEEVYIDDAELAGPVLELALERRRRDSGLDDDVRREAVVRLVELMRARHGTGEAIEVLREWTERVPADVEALGLQAELEGRVEDWPGVARTQSHLAGQLEGEAQARAALAVSAACEKMEDLSPARPVLEIVLRAQPGSDTVREELRRVYEELGAHAELAVMLQEDCDRVEDPGEKTYLLKRAGELFVRAGQADAALGPLTEAAILAPADAELSIFLADARMAQGELDDADAVLDGAIEVLKRRRSPELAMLQHRKARIALARGNDTEHMEWLDQAFATDRNNPDVALELADLAEANEDWDLAIKVLHRISLMEDKMPIPRSEAFIRQGRIWNLRGDRRRAVLWGRKAKQEDPDSDMVAAFLEELGDM